MLTYHRIDTAADPQGRHPGLVSATPAELDEQMALIASNFRPIGVDELLAAVRGDDPIPDRAILVTFDDAVDDFAHNAWPVLQRHDVPAVVFVPTAFVGSPSASFWWDALHAAVTLTRRDAVEAPGVGRIDLSSPSARTRACRSLRTHLKSIPYDEVGGFVEGLGRELEVAAPPARVMSWDQLRELAGQGLAVCAHTRSHPHLDRISIDAARREVKRSIDDLRAELGDPPPLFAYPGGQLTSEVVDVVRSSGIEAAFTTARGMNRLGSDDPLLLRRFNVSRRTGVNAIRVQMNPWAARALATRRSDRRQVSR
ncbi:MAG: polysaccharide deacetylase family protein [Acidimicrobiales bacterium]